MLLARDFVAYMSREIVRRLVSEQMIEVSNTEALVEKVRQAMIEELTVEDRLNEEVRKILDQWSEEMRRQGVSYQEMYRKVKGQLARERKLILR
jgi:hypothetical protein